MKTIYIKLLILLLMIGTWMACNSDGEVRDLGVTNAKALYEPTDGRTLTLQASASAMLYF